MYKHPQLKPSERNVADEAAELTDPALWMTDAVTKELVTYTNQPVLGIP